MTRSIVSHFLQLSLRDSRYGHTLCFRVTVSIYLRAAMWDHRKRLAIEWYLFAVKILWLLMLRLLLSVSFLLSGKYKHIKMRLVCHIFLLKIFLYDGSRAKWDPYTEYQGTDRIGPNPVRPGFKTLLAKNQFCWYQKWDLQCVQLIHVHLSKLLCMLAWTIYILKNLL